MLSNMVTCWSDKRGPFLFHKQLKGIWKEDLAVYIILYLKSFLFMYPFSY